MVTVWRAAYLGENVVRENEYLSAIMPVWGAQDADLDGKVGCFVGRIVWRFKVRLVGVAAVEAGC